MGEFAARTVVRYRTLLLAVCMASCVGCEPAEKSGNNTLESKATMRLTIISPHSERIRSTFSDAFARWYDSNFQRDVTIEWIVRGTPQCVEYISDIFEGRNVDAGMKTPDLMFGGGLSYHRALAAKDRCFAMDLGDALAGIPADVHGLPTRDDKNRWVATGLSSFGILFNDADCTARGVEPPSTWTDLADPRFSGWLSIADPAKSGSNRQCMMLILQHQGWDEGWGTLVRILANARVLESGSVRGHDQIASGVMLGGFSVNFDGLRRVQENPGSLRYINPSGATAVTPDIVSIVKTAADARLAEQFVKFCLSDEGQATWSALADGEGHSSHTLYHYPIKPSLYESHQGKLSVPDNPFETDLGVQVDQKLAAKQSKALVHVAAAICNENHILLQQVWSAIRDAGMPKVAVDKLCEPIVSEREAFEAIAGLKGGDSDTAALRKKWSVAFRSQLEAVMALATGPE